MTEVEAIYRVSVAAGEPGPLFGLEWWLGGQPGREAEAREVALFGLDKPEPGRT